ncbi:PE-PPE domain-containing protein [Mycolicibacterium sp.]|uniref:PE-PPE domain-containing protein n=1 Tax=Mycolicibacterium sp. TaxID=2320850 RepID=UPI00355D58A9
MRTFKSAKRETARARRRRIDGTKTRKAVLVGAAVATAVSVGLTPPIANAVSSNTYFVGFPDWMGIGEGSTLPSDAAAIEAAIRAGKDTDPLIAWGLDPVSEEDLAPRWATWFNPANADSDVTWSGNILNRRATGTATGWSNGRWVSPSDPGVDLNNLGGLSVDDVFALNDYISQVGGIDKALARVAAPLLNWTTYLSNTNIIAYGDGSIAAGVAYKNFIDAVRRGDVEVGTAETGPRKIVIIDENDPAAREFVRNFSNVGVGTGLLIEASPGVWLLSQGSIPYPDKPGEGPAVDVIPGGVIDVTLLTLTLLRNPGRPNGGLYSRFAPIYEEVNGVNPVSPEREDVLPEGLEGLDLAALLTGQGGLPEDLTDIATLLATIEDLDGNPVVVTLKTDLTWEYDLLSDAPVTANPVAWANSAAASLLVLTLGASLLNLDEGAPGLEMYVAPDGTIYGTLTQEQLPLLAPSRLVAGLLSTATGEDVNTPLSDAVEPFLKVLTNTAYTDVVRNVDADGVITYDRTYDEMHEHLLFGTQTLTRAERAQLAGDLIAVLGAGIGAELTDVGWRTVGRVQELLAELDIEVPEEVSTALAKAIPVPGNVITKVSSELGAGVSDLLGEVEQHLPEEVTLSQKQLEDLQRPVGQAIKPVKDVVDDVSAGLEQAAGQFADGPATGDQEVAGVVEELKVAADDAAVDSKPVSKTRAQQSIAKVRADLKEARDDVRADVKKASDKAKKAVKKAGDDIKKSVKDTAEKVKKAVTPKKQEKKADTSDSDD